MDSLTHSAIPVDPPPVPHLEDYAAVVGQAEIHELRELAMRLSGRRVKMVNSTAVGGGVAEILNRLVPLLNELGVQTQWEVLKGGNDFFAVTKAFHNALHGESCECRPEWFDLFLTVNEENRRQMGFDEDFIVIHDPQPLALVQAREGRNNHWIWRCHIDLSRPNAQVWNFLRPMVERFDAAMFSAPPFTQSLPIPQYLFYPSIDPLSDKNRELPPEFIQSVLERFQVDPKRPILTQISRFDRLKDPVGVVQAYRKVRKYFDCQLVLAGGGATDDPEGDMVLREVQEAAQTDPDIHILNLPPWSHLEINALQRASTIVIQKSLREGFGLTVAEALLKKKPVVASAVGGIPVQVIHKVTGVLAHSIEGTAYQIRFLLSNPDFARRLGENGHEHVKENFLLTHNIRRYLLLFLTLQQQ
ncbi:MAG: glycosyl transferase family 1 [Acidobacteria bacterium RIFCSPLOWO2_02_FULL_61_28]|nr:MAG: glycosyl transferase family 1 [Acidobacteria bacterium RIFCSPLOWO2_02_FULL_61_28]